MKNGALSVRCLLQLSMMINKVPFVRDAAVNGTRLHGARTVDV